MRRTHVGILFAGASLALAGCGSGSGAASGSSTSYVITVTQAPQVSTTVLVPLPTTSSIPVGTAPAGLDLQFPVWTAKGYEGAVHVVAAAPAVWSTGQGEVEVGPVVDPQVTLTDQTPGGQVVTAYGFVTVRIGWTLPDALSRSAGGAKVLMTVLLAGVPPDGATPQELASGQPLALQIENSRDTFGDGAGALLGAPTSTQFPQSARAALEQLVAGPPDVVSVVAGGEGDDNFALHGVEADFFTGYACDSSLYGGAGMHVLGVAHNGAVVAWPDVTTVLGQPCYGGYGSAPRG